MKKLLSGCVLFAGIFACGNAMMGESSESDNTEEDTEIVVPNPEVEPAAQSFSMKNNTDQSLSFYESSGGYVHFFCILKPGAKSQGSYEFCQVAQFRVMFTGERRPDLVFDKNILVPGHAYQITGDAKQGFKIKEITQDA